MAIFELENENNNDFGTAQIKVIGVGGAGGNAINHMIEQNLSGVTFISVNTDAMALENSLAPHKVQIGSHLTKGLGAGANPLVGRDAIHESHNEIRELLSDADMVFITAGMGGGTGTGGAPVIGQICRELDILTVAIVTYPFVFEGRIRAKNAQYGISELQSYVDSIIVIPNQKLLSIVSRNTGLKEAFLIADKVLYSATRSISDLIAVHGLVNVDFADVRTIMRNSGYAIMGTGTASGDNRAAIAADLALNSPLLSDVSIEGARGLLVNVTGGPDLTLFDVGDATQTIFDAIGEDSETNIIFGAVTDPELSNEVHVTVVATNINMDNQEEKKPQ